MQKPAFRASWADLQRFLSGQRNLVTVCAEKELRHPGGGAAFPSPTPLHPGGLRPRIPPKRPSHRLAAPGPIGLRGKPGQQKGLLSWARSLVSRARALVNGARALVSRSRALVSRAGALVNWARALVNWARVLVSGARALVNGAKALVSRAEAFVNVPRAANTARAFVNRVRALVQRGRIILPYAQIRRNATATQ